MKKCILNILFLINDLLIFFLSLCLAYYTRAILGQIFPGIFPDLNFSFLHYLQFFWMPLFLVLILIYENLYTIEPFQFNEIKRIFKVVFFWLVITYSVIGLTKKSGEISRTIVLLNGFYLIVFLPLSRLTLKAFFLKKIWPLKKVFIIGLNESIIKVAKYFIENQEFGYKIICFFNLQNDSSTININGLNFKVRPLKLIDKALELNMANCVLISTDLFNKNEDLLNFLSKIQKCTSEIFLVSKEQLFPFINLEIFPLYTENISLFKIKSSINSVFNKFFKNLIDYSFTFCLLPFVILLGLIIIIFIKIDSPGPIFFVHERVGKKGKKIRIYKFRTMYHEAEKYLNELLNTRSEYAKEWEERRKLVNDPRITRVGKILRRFSLDELPQFINILKGEMSLIGPRPVTQEELDKYYGEFKYLYYQVKPGITGLWQVMGRNEIKFPARVLLDVFYILNWSIWLDLYILFKTPIAVISGRGAY